MKWMTRILTSSYANFSLSWYKFFTFCNLYYTYSLYGSKLFAKAWRFLVVKAFQLCTWCTCCLVCKASKHNINPLRFKFSSHFPFIDLELLCMLYEWWFVVYLGGFGWPICKQFCNLVWQQVLMWVCMFTVIKYLCRTKLGYNGHNS